MSATQRPYKLSAALARVVGSDSANRPLITKKVWEYIKAHSLQDQAAKRKINCDSALKAVFNKDQIDMNEIMGGVSPHLTKVEVPAAPQQLK